MYRLFAILALLMALNAAIGCGEQAPPGPRFTVTRNQAQATFEARGWVFKQDPTQRSRIDGRHPGSVSVRITGPGQEPLQEAIIAIEGPPASSLDEAIEVAQIVIPNWPQGQELIRYVFSKSPIPEQKARYGRLRFSSHYYRDLDASLVAIEQRW